MSAGLLQRLQRVCQDREMFTDFAAIVDNRHQQAKELKARGRSIIGYLCSYVPEELIYAAGAIPVRILTSKEPPTMGDAHMQSYYCPFARSILHQGLKGDYDYIDGLVSTYTCTTMRLAFDSWELNIPVPFVRYLHIPCVIDTPEARQFYISELRRLRCDLEDLFGHKISDDDLRQAIQTYDENRYLTQQLFELRKADAPPLSGTEAYQVTLSSMLSDKAEHNVRLRKLLQELPHRPLPAPPVGRLMVVGSPLDNLDLLTLVEESLSALVVTDDTCTGTRYFYGTTPASPDGDPIEAIADRYMLSRAPCPTKYSPMRWAQCLSCPYRAEECFLMRPAPRLPAAEDEAMPGRMCRFRHMLQLAASHRVEGVMVVLQKFCDGHGFDYPHVVQLFQGVGVPTVVVEIENVISPGQISTRVQAFLEMLQPVEYLIEPGILPEG